MFGNLNSFHESVAESKAQREQFDKTLVLSSNSERLLTMIILIFAVILVLSIWFLEFKIPSQYPIHQVKYEFIENGDIDNFEANILIKSDNISSLSPQSQIKLNCQIPGQRALTFNGIIQKTSLLADPISNIPTNLKWAQLNVDTLKAVDSALLKKKECRLEIQNEPQSLLKILLSE